MTFADAASQRNRMSSRRRILLIDADADDRALAARMLASGAEPLEADGVGDAAGFADRLARGGFAAVVTEHRLGWSDGPSVVRAVRGLYPDRPVVLFTAAGDPATLAAALRAGAAGYLPKASGGYLELAAVVTELLDRPAAGGAAATGAPGAATVGDLERVAHLVSHDLQAPLQLVNRYAKLLGERYGGTLGDKGEGFLRHLVDSAERMRRMLDDLLEYSRLGSQGRPFERIDLGAALDEAVGNLAAAIEEAGARVTHDPLPAVVADRSQMVRLFQNLVGNAVKFHGPAPPRVHVKATEENGGWRLSVDDNGIGIPAADRDRIFEMFQRLHTDSEYPGTGVGLAICKRIAERHGGTLAVESEPGKGSTFYVRLPKEPPEAAG